ADLGLGELGVGALEGDLGEVPAEDVVGLGVERAGGRGVFVQGLAHADFLGALSGEDECGCHRGKGQRVRIGAGKTKPQIKGHDAAQRNETYRCSATGTRAVRGAQVLKKMPLRFISSACGLGEKRRASALLMVPA